jgi:hypothetical protein
VAGSNDRRVGEAVMVVVCFSRRGSSAVSHFQQFATRSAPGADGSRRSVRIASANFTGDGPRRHLTGSTDGNVLVLAPAPRAEFQKTICRISEPFLRLRVERLLRHHAVPTCSAAVDAEPSSGADLRRASCQNADDAESARW